MWNPWNVGEINACANSGYQALFPPSPKEPGYQASPPTENYNTTLIKTIVIDV